MHNAYVQIKDYEFALLTYNVEFDDTMTSENLNVSYAFMSPKMRFVKTDSNYESLLEIHDKILLSAVDFKEQLNKHAMTVRDFEFLNDINKIIKEKQLQDSINDMERNASIGYLKGDWYEDKGKRYYKMETEIVRMNQMITQPTLPNIYKKSASK